MKKLIIISFLILAGLKARAQELSKWQIKAEYFTPINPFNFSNSTVNGFHFQKNFGFAAGVERDWRKKKRRRLYQTATIGYYNEVYFERVFFLETNLGLSFNVFKGLQTGFEIGTGLHRATSSNLVSSFENDKWVSKVDKSVKTNRIVPGLSINLGYDFGNHFGGKYPLTISVSTGGSILFPYIPELGQNLGLMRNNKITLKYRL